MARISAFLMIGWASPALAQEIAIDRMVTADAARWLRHEDPIVRGEAALILASRSEPQRHAAIVAIARDADPQARQRGLLALGLQASAGVVQVLDEILADQRERTSPAGLCAAYALGALPPDHAPADVARVLSSFVDGNWKRQGDVLLALLHGLRRHPQHGQLAALQPLYEARANRSPTLRAMLLELMLPDENLDAEQALGRLDRAMGRERLVLLRWYAANATGYDAALAAPIRELAESSPEPEVRASALAVLTRLRHPTAATLAARALRSRAPVEVEQGIRSALALDGSGMRQPLEALLLAAEQPELEAAMLRSWAAPPSRELLDHCARVAAERTTPLALRIAAATTLAQSDSRRAAPLLRDLLRSATAYDDLRQLSRILNGPDDTMPQLSRLLPDPPDLTLHPYHWQALLLAGHPAAVRGLLEVLAAPRSTAQLRAALTAWRRPMVIGPLPNGGRDLPTALRDLLAPGP